MTNRNAHNLTEIQKQTNIHFKILSNNSQVNFSSPNINLSNISQSFCPNLKIINKGLMLFLDSSESSKNKTIEETLEDVASIKSNFKSVLETVELDSNVLYNLNQKNKLQKMNLENYLIEQISFLKNVINDIKKTRFWISKLEIFQNEVHIFF